ncbi:MAG: homoserine kinase [Terriglobales bacterium]
MTEFRLRLPATSANLGPAFDTAAIAWNRFLTVRARPAEAFAVRARGRQAALCGELRHHLILSTYAEVLRDCGRPAAPLAMELENEIPIGKGCGSSAAARLAGTALAARFGVLGWDAQRIFEEAARREGHPDNAAACWWGGLVAAGAGRGGRIGWLQIPCPTVWPLLVAVPRVALATEAARAVLPANYSRGDAVANVQHAVMLLMAWREGREDLLSAAMVDRLHEPYRARLCPLLAALQPLAGTNGVLGVCLSGAGPSVLLVLRAASGAGAAKAALARAGLEAELIAAEPVPAGPGISWRRE